GHHLVINYFVLGDQVVMSPTFWGSEPTRTPAGMALPADYQGLVVLEREREHAHAFIQSLTSAQRETAQRNGRAGIMAGAGNDNASIPRAGLPGRDLTDAQRNLLLN